MNYPKISASNQARWARLSPEDRAKRLAPAHAARRGQPCSDEYKAKLSAAAKARWAARKSNQIAKGNVDDEVFPR